jgi:3',5'-cyclic AMP phosphodiesterase CpdA
MDRRSFLKFTSISLGIGTLYSVAPAALTNAEAAAFFRDNGKRSGEAVKPFTFVQLSDTHVGFNGPPDPIGAKPFERAVEVINSLPQPPELAIFTGDLTHDTEKPGEHAERMKQFKEITSRLKVQKSVFVPGEHDAGLDSGVLFREHFGETHYAFDHRGMHFVALDNVSRAKPEVGPEQIAWLKQDLARFDKSAPIVVFTHRPLFDLKPEWEWFTADGDDVMNVLSPYENVTVLYGHIHRDDEHTIGHTHHFAARSLCFAFPDPATSAEKKPLPFDKDQPFKNVGIREVTANAKAQTPIAIHEVALNLKETGGVNGMQQMLRAVEN